MRRAGLVAVLWVSTVLGSATAFAAPDPDRVALEAAMHRWMTAVQMRDAVALSATMTEDVELLDANAAKVAGRDAAIRALRDVAALGLVVATNGEITIGHDVAWRIVSFTQNRKNGVVHARGQAFEIWKRAGGAWQLYRQMEAGDVAPADLLTRPSTKEPVLDRP